VITRGEDRKVEIRRNELKLKRAGKGKQNGYEEVGELIERNQSKKRVQGERERKKSSKKLSDNSCERERTDQGDDGLKTKADPETVIATQTRRKERSKG